jgi:hypothetical protein
MNLRAWVKQEGTGAITRLQYRSGLSYTAVHRAVSGKSRPTYESANALAAATDGAVTVDEIFRSARRVKRKAPRARAARRRAQRLAAVVAA